METPKLRHAQIFGRSARVVSEKLDDGNTVEHEGQDAVEEAIWSNIHDERFYRAEQAPICQDRLRGEFGYQADTLSARQVLEDTYVYSGDFNESTKEFYVIPAWIKKSTRCHTVA